VAREQAFEYIAPALARHGYELSDSGGALVFRRRWRPAWTILVAVFMFPIGLVALIHQHEDEIIVELDEGLRGGTAVLAHGVGPRNVRRAFVNLHDPI
jgi:hypothetical protein